MSPILVRPVREQLEHDRVIRLLQAKYKRKFDVAINPGHEQTAPVGQGPSPWYPDLVLQAGERTKKLAGVIEVETAESVNHLEAMSQWATFSRLRVPFYLYVPASSIDTARRLCTDLNITAAEIWAYSALGDQLRFTLMHRMGGGGAESAKSSNDGASSRATRPRAAARPAAPAARPARRAVSATASRRPASGKTKAAAPRRAVAKSPARKPAPGSSRAQKRR